MVSPEEDLIPCYNHRNSKWLVTKHTNSAFSEFPSALSGRDHHTQVKASPTTLVTKSKLQRPYSYSDSYINTGTRANLALDRIYTVFSSVHNSHNSLEYLYKLRVVYS